ncbi:RelA/SpoT family protein [Acidihalobacter prosperus]|uniref:GTP pyrophosphokinase n=1 Tax=Acidihalobacter prosperus TaxID=160660 RepID=A0A1A6C8U5_9GAMM|nr:bifunctional (p)ppGpp synthetase/guanosine-3',5'-bis(diphosphate) 3'-pyrophosphohydrolase [Acidihalobacter prosperus]OBS10970.1 (p)ppGpp synthetase [Acidihalobacter prosperus]
MKPNETTPADPPPDDAERLSERLLEAVGEQRRGQMAQALSHLTEAGARERKRPDGRAAALRLLEMGADGDSVVAAVLADPRLRDRLSPEYLTQTYGATMASLVRNIHWLNTFKECREEFVQPPEQAEHLRRMLLAMVDDVRAVLVKLAYRVERLHLLAEESYETRRCIARETLDIYAPLANRLGLGQLKWALEDLAFRYLEPQTYKRLAKSLEETRDSRERYVSAFVDELRAALQAEGIEAETYGRPKHIYSIYKKISRKNIDLNDLYDIRAVRVLVDRVSTCYAVLGVVHGRWTHIPKEFDDYIANRKENGYQSLHTAVIGPEGKVVEVQIRTHEMHALAEQGVAAHWRYKEGGRQDEALDKAVNSLRNLLEHRDNDEELLESFHAELFGDRVFVLTPRGDVLDLPKGATPLDFAYTVHSEVGHRCRGAKVDGRIVPLSYTLKSGEQVEILTAREPNPSRDWYNPNTGYLYSARNRAKVRHWFAQLDRDQHLADGRAILEREAQRLGTPVPDLEVLVRRFHVQTPDELLLAIGRGDVRPGQIASALQGPQAPASLPADGVRKAPSHGGRPDRDAIRVQGVGNLLTQFAQCCKPAPGDPVVGYITKGEGVTIHRSDCPNVLNMPDTQRKRLIEADWGERPHSYPVDIHIEAFDRQGLLRDITQTLTNEKINVLAANTRTNRDDQSVIMDLEVEIVDIAQLSRILDKLGQLPNVISAERKH